MVELREKLHEEYKVWPSGTLVADCFYVLLLHRMAGQEPTSPLLLALPDPCLLAVLQCYAADDPCSVFSAAGAHSRLHQAAVVALRSITAVVHQQRDVAGVLLYLSKHGQHIEYLELTCDDWNTSKILQLPPYLHLTSLKLNGLGVQLQPGGGFQGVLGAASQVAALKQLHLRPIWLHDDNNVEALIAALSQLAGGLQHLNIGAIFDSASGDAVLIPLAALQQLQQLTYLELAGVDLHSFDEANHAAQPLQALTRLAELVLVGCERVAVSQ